VNLVERLSCDATFQRMVGRLRDDGGVVSAEGLWGSFAPLLVARAAAALSRPVLCITAHLEEADDVREDIELFLERPVEIFSAWEALPGEGAARDEIAAERLRLCSALREAAAGAGAGMPAAIVAPIQALMQPVPSFAALESNSLVLTRGEPRDPRSLAQWFVDQGFARLDLVESPGDFALRGGILDVYPYGHIDPVRVEFFGNEIESIRQFDVSTQRSVRDLKSVRIASPKPLSVVGPAADTTSFLSYLPAETIVAIDEPAEIQEWGRTFLERLRHPVGMVPVEAVFRKANEFTQLHLVGFGGSGDAERTFRFHVQSVQRFETKAAAAVGELCELAREEDVVVYCDNAGEQQRLTELVAAQAEDAADLRLHYRIGLLHRGFSWVTARVAVVGHHEVFHRYQQRRRIRRAHAARPIESWLDLEPGDLVVHVVHGIARFGGMKTQQKGDTGKTEEYLTLEFADKATVHVPSSQIDLVQKYVGAGSARPSLSKLGGTRWRKTKERVEEAVSDLAGELLKVQALRESQPGIAYPQDTGWQREFEEAFLYIETEDQIAVAAEIKDDMTRERPMDRLLCGDVGYGKTELAMRAAFKAAEYGNQVAVLVPTTVLAEQHYRTFRERMADYPFAIESLSRFRKRSEQDAIVKQARKGQIDILIGTHRLLSKDVGFANLGLVVIDEEQRFGVEHKERLKRFRETVDVLTLTATPIPRTLHMAMLGIRDISSLATPPADRRSIVTQVRNFDPELIRNAIVRELNRDGQVYFVHNFVFDIQSVADTVQQIVPEARIVVGHGQMSERHLEKAMTRFVRHDADVLVCTSIIESGLDIPNANTIIINKANRFGLADLHQLRGRVGRYKHRAYCYLLLDPSKPLTPTAAKRLKAIEEYAELGSGFRIAMRDLEIRGAGNILGPEQSGHIADVGYELYCQLLEAAVRRMRDEPVALFRRVHIELEVPAHIPKGYIASERQRMEVYRRVSACRVPADIELLEQDLKDAYGPFPTPVGALLQIAELRILAQPLKIVSIIQRPPDVVFSVEEVGAVDRVFTDAPGTVRMPDDRTIHLRLPESYFVPSTLLAVLRRLLAKPAGPPRVVTHSESRC
jgi:transcription-repair coupling factor (superfamily II helicase)